MVSQAGNSDNLMKEGSEMPGRRPKNVVTRRPSNNNNNGQQPDNSAVDDANIYCSSCAAERRVINV